MTYDPIASTTLTSSASSVTFSSLDTIAAGYRDLVLVIDGSSTGNGYGPWFRFNNSTSGYSFVSMRNLGSASSTSTTYTGQSELYNDIVNVNISTAANHITILQVFDFATTDKHKSVLIRTGNATISNVATAGRWESTGAITSILVELDSVDYAAGTTMSLYGIVA